MRRSAGRPSSTAYRDGSSAIVVTHFHPDHVGAARDVAELTGAPVAQGRLDYEQCELVWGGDDWGDVLVDWFARNGVPDEVTSELVEQGSVYRSFIHFQPDPGASIPATPSRAGRSSPRPAMPMAS